VTDITSKIDYDQMWFRSQKFIDQKHWNTWKSSIKLF